MNAKVPDPLHQQVHDLSRQVEQLCEILVSQKTPDNKFCLTVEELAQRWALSHEAIRRLVRDKRLRPLRGFRPFRFTMDEIHAYERSGDRSLDLLKKKGRS